VIFLKELNFIKRYKSIQHTIQTLHYAESSTKTLLKAVIEFGSSIVYDNVKENSSEY
jgi:hypothetical protein